MVSLRDITGTDRVGAGYATAGVSAASAERPAWSGVTFSTDTVEISEVARFITASENLYDFRKELVQQARENLEEGAHQIQSVVALVAERLFPMVNN